MNSQNNEEALISKYFGSHKGTFLDIGANDGVTLSNIWACVKRGWFGVCVEPSPAAFARLKRNMNPYEVEVFNVAIGATAGTMTLHDSGTHLKRGDVALLSTLDHAHAQKWAGHEFKPVDVEVITVRDLLAYASFPAFDLVTIDAEGLDLAILQQMDLTAMGVRMVIIEHEHSDIDAMRSYCEGYGMRHYATNRQNLIMVL